MSTDVELLAPLAIKCKLPVCVLKVTVEDAFLHCAKALIRARLWEPDAQVERSSLPTSEAFASEIDAGEEESARTELY